MSDTPAATAYYFHEFPTAVPERQSGSPGYRVTYPDGHANWCEKATFESFAEPMSPEMVKACDAVRALKAKMCKDALGALSKSAILTPNPHTEI